MLRGHLWWRGAVAGSGGVPVPAVLTLHHPCDLHRVLLPGRHQGPLEICQVAIAFTKAIVFFILWCFSEMFKTWLGLGLGCLGAAAAAQYDVTISFCTRTGNCLSGLMSPDRHWEITWSKYFAVSPPRQTVTWTRDSRDRRRETQDTGPAGRVYKWPVWRTQKTLQSSVPVNNFGKCWF